MTDIAAAKAYEAHQEALESAYRDLRTEFTKAAVTNPSRVIRTPGFSRKHMTTARAVAELCSANDEQHFIEQMLDIVARCTEGYDPQTRMPAMSLIAKMAHAHAETHKAELIEGPRHAAP